MGFPALAGGALALALPNQHLAAQETLGRVFGGGKKNLLEARGLTPWFWARTGLEPSLSREDRS